MAGHTHTLTEDLLPPHPDGWYCIALSKEVKKGEIISRKFMDRDVVVFRTESGEVAVTDAYCPHLGAHLGKGGEIRGEDIWCPFHGFCFNTQGDCTDTGYGTKVPPRAKLGVYGVKEVAGLVLVYFDNAGQSPTWHIPDVDMDGWSDLRVTQWEFRGHPQETSENSVDVKHLEIVHKYTGVKEIVAAKAEGPLLTARYGMTRPGLFRKSAGTTTEFDVYVHGLGYSFVDVEVLGIGVRTRQWVLSTPTEDDKIILRIASSTKFEKKTDISPALALMPRSLVTKIISRATMRGFEHDVQQDFDIWQHKKYVVPPVLAQGDGPIGLYRRWARQFYPELREKAA